MSQISTGSNVAENTVSPQIEFSGQKRNKSYKKHQEILNNEPKDLEPNFRFKTRHLTSIKANIQMCSKENLEKTQKVKD